ncbi:GrpB family protein [Candidatus Woesebacteria bacterium]|nr:MAG: GrpB family protein [Candidatus Woesebacteria bacterium]
MYKNYQDIDTYISHAPGNIQNKLNAIRKLITSNNSDITECINYGIPTFKYNGKNLVHFALFKSHIGFYPTPSAISHFSKQLQGYTTSKGAIHLKLDQKIPVNLLKSIVTYRIKEEIDNSSLTKSQQRWINHLSDTDTITILPFDKTASIKFEMVQKLIQDKLGSEIPVEHHGASSLGISGQDEIDIYIPVPKVKFVPLSKELTKIFGAPRSFYPYERARFVTNVDRKNIDIFLVNKSHKNWKNSEIFSNYLKTHPKDLDTYRLLKERGNGTSMREYYRKKTLFINKIVQKASEQPSS